MDASKMKLESEQSVLVVVDFQERIASAIFEKIRKKTLKNIFILLRAAETLDMPVIPIEHYVKGLGPTVSELAARIQNYPMIEKIVFSAFKEKDFFDALMESGRKNIILAGIETHVCVYQTTRDLIASGFTVTVPEDAVASRTKQNWLRGLELCRDAGALVSSAEAVVYDLLHRAGTPQFKDVAPLLK